MKKFKKILAITLSTIMILSTMCVSALATEYAEENIQFVETDENGNIIDIIDLVYIDEVAEAYEQRKLQRWVSTSYYNLGNGAYTMNGGEAAIVECRKHFNANSSGRLYYYGEVTDANARLDIYDITNNSYKGTFPLRDQGDGVYSKNGYITGLNSSSSQYYSFGLAIEGMGNFSSYYAAISWNAL